MLCEYTINKPIHWLYYEHFEHVHILLNVLTWFDGLNHIRLEFVFNIKVSPAEIYKILKQFESFNRFCFSFILNTLSLCTPPWKVCKSIPKRPAETSLTRGVHTLLCIYYNFLFSLIHTICFFFSLLLFFSFNYLFIFITFSVLHRCTVNHCKRLRTLLVSLNPKWLGPIEP